MPIPAIGELELGNRAATLLVAGTPGLSADEARVCYTIDGDGRLSEKRGR